METLLDDSQVTPSIEKEINDLYVKKPTIEINEQDIPIDFVIKQTSKLESDVLFNVVQNAVSSTKINVIGLNRDLLNSVDDVFTHKLDTWKVTNQKSSGRCWIFAGVNLFKEPMIKETGGEFEFSQNYIAFWDKFERANYFMEAIIETYQSPITDETVRFLLDSPISDGGQWDMFVNILKKYGAIPKRAMQETESSSSSQLMNANLNYKLRECAKILRTGLESGKSLDEIRSIKHDLLSVIYKMLCIHLGTPPESFPWTYQYKSKFMNEGTLTPHQFANKYIQMNDLDNYICLINDPRKTSPFNKTFTVKFLGNLPNRPVRYLNVNAETMRSIALNMLLDNRVVWFGCDVRKNFESEKGVWDENIFTYDVLYGDKIEMTKEDRLLYQHSKMSHAMVFTGVDVREEDGLKKSLKWRVENSWGERKGNKGFYVMNGNEWFDEYVFEIAAHKKFLSKELLEALEEDPIELPPWDPMGALAQSSFHD